ncbi:MAG: glycosyltransferase family 4 protein [Cyanobacteria bacterium P01_F01_bin.150]
MALNPLLITFVSTLALSLFSVGIVRRVLRDQLLDIPNERSSHKQPTPRGGGLGFIIAIILTFAIAQSLQPNLLAGFSPLLWLTLLPLIGVGIVDDWRNLPSSVRYLVQLTVAVMVVYQCGPFPFPGLDMMGEVGHWIAIGLTLIGVTALINFYNFMDGLDGLVAGVSATQLAFLAVWYHQPVLWFWVAALLGFLYWNWSPAKIFMGDAGSTTLGAIAGISLLSPSQVDMGLSWMTLTILLPLVGDAIYTLVRRLMKGENIFQAHRTHLYQRLNQAGWPHSRVAGIYILYTLLIAFGLNSFGSSAAWVALGMIPIVLVSTELLIKAKRSPVDA